MNGITNKQVCDPVNGEGSMMNVDSGAHDGNS